MVLDNIYAVTSSIALTVFLACILFTLFMTYLVATGQNTMVKLSSWHLVLLWPVVVLLWLAYRANWVTFDGEKYSEGRTGFLAFIKTVYM